MYEEQILNSFAKLSISSGDFNIGDPATKQPTTLAVVKIPEFELPSLVGDDSELFFALLESVFKQYQIRSSDRKFTIAVNRLPQQVLADVRDLVMQRPEVQPYEALKKRVLYVTVKANYPSLLQSLDEETITGKKPSSLYRRLKIICEKLGCGEKYLRGVFAKKLPHHVRQGLIGYMDLEESLFLRLADQHAENRLDADISQVTASLDSAVANRVDAVLQRHHMTGAHSSRSQSPTSISQHQSHQISCSNNFHQQHHSYGSSSANQTQRNDRPFHPAFQNNRSIHRQSRQFSSGRPCFRFPSPVLNSGLCFYHEMFGNNATRCEQPCSRFPMSEN